MNCRPPLAVRRAQIEALQDGVRQPDAAQLRLSRLVQDLKILTYAREAEFVADMGRADLVEIAYEAIASARPALVAAQIENDCAFPETLVLKCDQLRIAQVIDNPLQNAARYTDAPGKLRLQMWRGGGFAHMAIDDTLPVAPADVLPRSFGQ